MKKSKRKLALNMLAEILFIILFAVAIVICWLKYYLLSYSQWLL